MYFHYHQQCVSHVDYIVNLSVMTIHRITHLESLRQLSAPSSEKLQLIITLVIGPGPNSRP